MSKQNNPIITAVKTLATADPDYQPFLQQHRGLSFSHISSDVQSELEHDLLTLLQQIPDRSTQLEKLSQSNERSTFDGGTESVPLLLAATFLLRTHLRIKKNPQGKWEFLAEHKPGNSQLVNQLLAKISRLLSGQ